MKMKHMVWRAVRGVLPTKETLQRRGIEVEWNCGVSNGNPETPWHLLLDCEVARDCWQEAGVSREVVKLKEEIESFNEWEPTVSHSNGGRHECNKWHSPMCSEIKCNVDALIFEQERRIGYGACVRDSQDRLVQFRMAAKYLMVLVKEAEAWALAEVMSWIQHLGHTEVEFENDAKVVVDSINGEDVISKSLAIVFLDAGIFSLGIQGSKFGLVGGVETWWLMLWQGNHGDICLP
ncbi:hypothetical protein LINPERPRIM_LOCUS30158 [Linum perenne]